MPVAAGEQARACGLLGGRPTEYTEEIAELILHRLSAGDSLRSIVDSDERVPGIGTLMGWVADDREGFRARYARARECWTHAAADRVMHRAETCTDSASAQASRAFTDAAKLILPAYNRATFGQQLQVQHEVRVVDQPTLDSRTVDALAQRPELIALALASPAGPRLRPLLEARGLLPPMIEGEVVRRDPPLAPNRA